MKPIFIIVSALAFVTAAGCSGAKSDGNYLPGAASPAKVSKVFSPRGSSSIVLTYSALGDSGTAPYHTSYPPDNSIKTYPQVADDMLGDPYYLQNLGVGGEGLGYQALWNPNAGTCSGYPLPSIFTQIPQVSSVAVAVTVEVGTDEMLARAQDVYKGCRGATAQQDADAMLAEYKNALAQIRARAPNAQIIIFNNANIEYFYTGWTLTHPPGFNMDPWIVDSIRDLNTLYKPNGVQEIVDSACDANLYNPNNFTPPPSQLGIHPNQLGQNELASKLIWTVNNANVAPQSDCSFLH